MKYQSGSLVTAVDVSAAGSGFTARPTTTLAAAPAGGVNATATAVGKVLTATVVGAGTGYAEGDILSVAGGTGTAATIRVLTVTGTNDAIATVEVASAGAYTVLPTLTANGVTGGTGTGATITLTIGLGPVTVTNGGLGYLTAPAVTIGGAGGTGAAAAATLDDPNYVADYSRTTLVTTTMVCTRMLMNGLTPAVKVWGEA
jgi:hypothetical protein